MIMGKHPHWKGYLMQVFFASGPERKIFRSGNSMPLLCDPQTVPLAEAKKDLEPVLRLKCVPSSTHCPLASQLSPKQLELDLAT